MAKVSASELSFPRAMDLDSQGGSREEVSTGSIHLKKQLGLLDGVAIIVGIIIGSGIFLSPGMTLHNSGSAGMALIVWVLSGILTMVGALCYAELGTMIPKSGGDYAYIVEAFGPLPGFLYLWVALLILVPTGNAITAVVFAKYILAPLWPDCAAPDDAVRFIATLVTCLLTVINCYDVKWVTRVQSIFTASKMLALAIIIGASLWYLGLGHTENLQEPMKGTTTDPSMIASAFYGGLFSYSGWNYLNFVTEELKDPNKNLPRAIYISMPLVTLVYTVTNLAYFIVLPHHTIATSEAVAVAFSDKMLGVMSWTMPLFVACCTFGSLNGAIYASSRLFFVGARNGHLPLVLSLIDVKRLTPVPSLIFLCIITLLMLIVTNTETLIIYTSFAEAIFTMMSVCALLYMRHTHPELPRPIRVHLALPIIFSIICVFLIIFPCFRHTLEVGIATAIILLGIPVYMLTIRLENKPAWLLSAYDSFNIACSKMFLCVPESSKDLCIPESSKDLCESAKDL